MSKKKDKGVFEGIDEIKLGGFLFDLRFVEDDSELPSKYTATHNSRDEKISVLFGSKTSGEAILHECCHNVLNRIKSHEDDEEFNSRLSYALYAVMRDNPELIIQILRENREERIDKILRGITNGVYDSKTISKKK